MNSNWYFIDTHELSGIENMAVDVTLATGYYDKPCLRFYMWNPYALSLGYNQPADFILTDKLNNSGIDLVRRPTGGRAVLHAEELTYSVVIPSSSSLFEENIHKIYRMINLSLNKGLEYFGINSRLERRKVDKPGRRLLESTQSNRRLLSSKNNPACFSSAARSEIKFNGKKIIGSAQRRYKNSILQHGSILLGSYHLNIKKFFKNIPQSIELKNQSSSLSEIIGKKIDTIRLKDCLLRGFENIIDAAFEEKNNLSELLAAAEKIKNKFKV